MPGILLDRNAKLIISLSQKLFQNVFCSRQAATAGAAASSMMRSRAGDDGKRKPKVRLHKNRRKNLTRAEKLNPSSADWPSIAAVAESFNPAVIPLPIRMGRPRPNKVGDIPPVAHGNIELLKIPNFFHLTPPAIERHCNALKPLCSPWPKDLKKKPIRIVTNNYIYPGPSIRHPDSRIVQLKIFLRDLELDDHARTKLILLAGSERYCKNTDELTIVADKIHADEKIDDFVVCMSHDNTRCPTRSENKEYAMYLFTALYQEAWSTEEWEEEIPKGTSLEDLQSMIAEVLSPEQKQRRKQKKLRARNLTRIVADKLIRFNRHGKAFVLENSKYDIKGPVQKEDRDEIEREWQVIKP